MLVLPSIICRGLPSFQVDIVWILLCCTASCSHPVATSLTVMQVVLGLNPAPCFSRKPLRYTVLGTGCTLTAVPRLTQPSTLCGMVKRLSAFWLSNNKKMVMCACLAYGSLLADSKVKFAAWPRCLYPSGTVPHSFKWSSELLQWLCHKWRHCKRFPIIITVINFIINFVVEYFIGDIL